MKNILEKIVSIPLTVLLMASLWGCGRQQPEPVPTPVPQTKVQSLMEKMSTKEKVGQLFIIRPESLDSSLSPNQANSTYEHGVSQLTDEMADTLKNYPAGGVALFGKNIYSPDQTVQFITDLQTASDTGMFIAVDEEGGSVSRLAANHNFDLPQYSNIGTLENEEQALAMYTDIGSYLRKYGFNFDFAPVTDVNTNPDNIVIGSRAFGSDPDKVAGMVAAAVDGLHKSNIITSIKHFPGHGDTVGDTHNGFVQVDKTWQEMLDCEIIPFAAALDKTDTVMVAHIACPAVTGDNTPASLSHTMITGKLRGELGFDRIVITDSLSMNAVTDSYTSRQAAVAAIQAGADILLMSYDYISAFDGVYAAVTDGIISEDRLDESVERILTLKEKYGII